MSLPTNSEPLRLTESAKAFINAIEGDNVVFTSELSTIEQYENTIQLLRNEVKTNYDSLSQANDKYQNLRSKFTEVCQERDQLAASQMNSQRAKAEIQQLQQRLKSKDQEIQDLQKEIARVDPRDPLKIVEDLYQAYRTIFARYGFDTSRKKTLIEIRVSCEGAVVAQSFARGSATNYQRSNISTNLGEKHRN